MGEQILADLRWFFEQRGSQRYELGNPSGVSQLEHALQCAALAEHAGAEDSLVTAALLHDLGHLVFDDNEDDGDDADDLHQYRAIPLLRVLFDETVLAPIKLHVDAKRYLCAVEPQYYDDLSPGSKHSLALQGGAFAPFEVSQFLAQPYAREGILLRRWDDQAKVKGRATPSLDHFLFIARRCIEFREISLA